MGEPVPTQTAEQAAGKAWYAAINTPCTTWQEAMWAAVDAASAVVRAQTLAEAADAIDADAAGRLDTHQAWLRKSAELVRGL